ncbi:hypothetical protein ACS5PN_02405 [Roseateles sp. NT4]|uniref:hypothetical protein n=1 Tax=Roseateles sp. NT4 TaxID=3453715 RepID=UPI003EEA8A13
MRNQDLVHISSAELEPFSAQLRHQLTMLSESAHSRADRHTGLTIWSTPNRVASVYWSWVMTDEGIPVLADPLAIKSNLLFTEPGRIVTIDDQLIGINMLVCALPWQQEVIGHLARLRLPAVRSVETERRRGKSRAHAASRSVALAA